jgi:hypothetical protein
MLKLIMGIDNMEKKSAVVIIDTQMNDKGEYIPSIVKEGETGHYPTDWAWGTDREQAQKIADSYNIRLGLSLKEAMELTLQSMRVKHDSVSCEVEA